MRIREIIRGMAAITGAADAEHIGKSHFNLTLEMRILEVRMDLLVKLLEDVQAICAHAKREQDWDMSDRERCKICGKRGLEKKQPIKLDPIPPLP